MILWRGHCSVHGRFSAQNVADIRAAVPGVNVMVHPECKHEVVTAADYVGSTEYIIKQLDAAEPGSSWAIGTELNLVRRVAKAHPDKNVHYLDSTVCFCSTMNRIDLPHLVWAMESLVGGTHGEPDRRGRRRRPLGARGARPDAGPPGNLTRADASWSGNGGLRIGIFVFDGAEELDVVGPFEVFAAWGSHSASCGRR